MLAPADAQRWAKILRFIEMRFTLERISVMEHFPDFMKNPKNKIDPAQQNTPDIEGYYYEGADGSQIAFWECHADRT